MTEVSVVDAGDGDVWSLVTSRNATIPEGTEVGNLLVLVVAIMNGATFTPGFGMTGWTQVSGSPIMNATFDGLYVFTRTASLGDAGSTFVLGAFSANVRAVVRILALDGNDPTNPIDVALAGSVSNTLGATHTGPTATAVEKSTPLLFVTDRASSSFAPTLSWTWPDGFTEVSSDLTNNQLNAGDISLGIAIGNEVSADETIGPDDIIGNELTHFASAMLLIREYTPAVTAQLEILDDSGWHPVNIVGVGETGTIKAVTLVDYLSGLHSPDVAVDFSDGLIPSPPFSFNVGASVINDAADPNGSSEYGVYLVPDPSNGASSITKADGIDPYGNVWASIKVRFKCVTLPGATNVYDNLFEIGNELTVSPKGQFTVYWKNRILYADFNTEDATNLNLAADNEWHTIEARVYFGATAYTANVRVDGGTPIQMTSVANKTPSVVGALWVGYPTSGSSNADYERYIGSVKMSSADTDPGWLA